MVQVHLGKHKAHKAHCKWHSSQNGAMHVGAHADCAANGASDIKNREAHTRTHTHTQKPVFAAWLKDFQISVMFNQQEYGRPELLCSVEINHYFPTCRIWFLPAHWKKKTGRNLEPGRKFKSLEAQSTYRWRSSKSFVFLKKYIIYCFPH